MAARIQALGVRPEVEIFDTGHLLLAKWLHGQGLLDDPVMVQLCMGIPWGAPDDLATLLALTANLPADWTFSAFSIGRNQLRLRGCRACRRRQHPRRPRGQSVAWQGRAGDQRRAGRARGHHRRSHGIADPQPRPRA